MLHQIICSQGFTVRDPAAGYGEGARNMISMRLLSAAILIFTVPGMGRGHVSPWIRYCFVSHCKRYGLSAQDLWKKTRTFTLSVRFRLYSFGLTHTWSSALLILGTRPFTHPVVRCDLDFYPLGAIQTLLIRPYSYLELGLSLILW